MGKSSHLDIDNINFLKMFWVALTHRTTFCAAWRLFASAVTEFFVPQFATKLKLSRIPVVSVDHPLDETIPFDPRYIHTYLNFYPFWIRCIYFLYKEFGKRTLGDIRDFMYLVADSYYEAGRIYRRCQSTTRRPKYLKNAKFILLHAADPHLHCVPSLHVVLVTQSYLSIPALIDKYSGENSARYKPQKDLIYRHAVEITESILYMKQHSVNCVPAALYFMTKRRPDFAEEKVLSFIEDLFTGDEGVPATAEIIKEFFRSQYHWMMSECIPEDGDYKDVLVRFLLSYQAVES